MASEAESVNRKAILEALERRLRGKAVPATALIKRARQFPEFARAWLAHAVGGAAGKTELAVALAVAGEVQPDAVVELHSLWTDVARLSDLEIDASAASRDFAGRVADYEFSADRVDPDGRSSWVWAIILAMAGHAISARQQYGPVASYSLPVHRAAIDALCDYARPRLAPASVYGRQQRGEQERRIRDSDQAVIAAPTDSLLFNSIERLIALACGQELVQAEPMSILRYRPGQQYRWHRDYIQASSKTVREELARAGQRIHTGILYLSDDFTGGQTEFRDWDLSLRIKAGECVSFSNVDQHGEPNPASVHRGAPVESGEKWIGTLWFRSKRLWNREGLMPVQDSSTT